MSSKDTEAATAGTPPPDFQALLDRQPYDVELDGLSLRIAEDVFPPDLGRSARNMARFGGRYGASRALDMGCGSGYIALRLKQQGVEEVWAADVHGPAVACARANVERNAHVGPVTVIQSDLFAALPAQLRFDLIVFNQPYSPAVEQPLCGCGFDGGYSICRRFLLEAPAHLNAGGAMLMSFSDRNAAEHRPDRAADDLGYPVSTLLHLHYGGADNFIFEIRLPPDSRAERR